MSEEPTPPEPLTGWLEGADQVETYWPTASDETTPEELTSLLTAARIQCETFAPTLAEDADVPETYRRAQAMQARALWRSQVAGSGDQIGADGMTVTVFPMDWTVKALLRPKRKPTVR